jgi:hypothetical protein
MSVHSLCLTTEIGHVVAVPLLYMCGCKPERQAEHA